MRRILASALAGLVLCGVPHTTPAQTAPAAACSTAPASAPSWGLRPLPVGVRAIAPGDTLPLSVSICNPMPVERVTAAPVELIEQATKRKFADGRVALCPTSSPCNGEPFRLEGSGGHRVWLVTQSNATPLPGKYDGAVTVFSADKPGGESVSLTVHVTSWEWQVFGFLLILAGIAAAWYVTSFMRQRLAREQLLLPAVVLRADIDKLAHTLGALPRAFATPEIDAKLAAVNELLSDEALERQGLPPRIPLPWQGPNASINADAFRKHIEAQAAWISALQRIVDDGVVKLVGLRRGATASGGPLTDLQQQAFAEALGRLDQCVFRTIVTGRFGSVTAEFGSVTGHFGDVTDGHLVPA